MIAPTYVGIQYSAFAPARVEVVAGDTVSWRNGSTREHTVNGPDFASDRIPRYGGFSHTFSSVGQVSYVCTLHPGMAGSVDVEPILLDAPGAPVAQGRRIVLTGRAQAAVTSVRLERDLGKGFVEVGRVPVDSDGMFRASLPAGPSGAFRAVADGGLASPPVRVIVLGQQVRAAAVRSTTRRTVRVTTLPARPGATVVLQLLLRDRFGWWPDQRGRLDRRGRATFTLAPGGHVRVRVVLTERDGATGLARSRVLRFGRS